MIEVTIEVLSQLPAITDHQIINRTTAINVIITEQMITIMLVCLTATQDSHKLALTVFKRKRMTSSHDLMLTHKDTEMHHSTHYRLNVNVFTEKQQ